MYGGIFDDFEIIKRHCRNNGNIKFEELAVFELLENLAPQYGAAQGVQMILEMLDAQTVRDCNTIKTENVQTDNSNDSIIEVIVPEKCHPIIDLTDDSVQVNETSVIEKTPKYYNNSNIESDMDSNSHEDTYFAGQSDNGLSDSDITKNADDCWNQRGFNNELALPEILALYEESNQSNQFESNQINSNVPEVSEMLEENNNDPNNNLDGTIFEEELTDITNGNNNERLHLVNNVTENSNSNDILRELIDPVPGCSKDTGIEETINKRVNNTPSLPNISINQPASPIPGCSKDFNNSNNFDNSKNLESHANNHDESIIEDALCIQNLLHWADWDIILTILEKYRDSPNRKQLVLWDLVSEASNTSTADSKRKSDSDDCTIAKKCMKMEVDVEDNSNDWLDLTSSLNQFDNTVCNESNDSVGNSELSNEIIKQNQNSNDSVVSESSNVLNFKRPDDYRKLIDVSNQLLHNKNHQSQLSKTKTCTLPKSKFNSQNLSNASLIQQNDLSNPFINFTNPPIKKERVETIVSGSLNVLSNVKDVEIKSKETNNVKIHKLLNNEDKQYNNNCTDNLSQSTENRLKEIQEINAVDQRLNYDTKVDKETSSKAEKINLIKPAKLNIDHKLLARCDIVKPAERISYIRPASFSLESRINQIHTKRKSEIVCKVPDELDRNKQIKKVKVPLAFDIVSNVHDVNQPSSSNQEKEIEPESFPQNVHIHWWGNGIRPTGRPVNRSYIIKPPKMDINTPTNEALLVPSNTPGAISSDSENYDHLIYRKLRSIFPDIKSSYIKKICKNPPVLVDFNNKSQALDILVDHLLKEGNNHMQPLNIDLIEPKVTTVLSIDEQYECLLGIFPNADPTFLRKFVEENINKENVVEQFIQEKLETHDYPTKEQYLAKIKVTEQIKAYTTDFNVEKFLEMFPDPFKYFEDEKRVCVHQPIAMEFLKSHFHKNKVTTICRFYTMNKYNLSLTAKALTKLGYDMKSKRMALAMPTENIPLLQEMAFLKHKQSIISYISSRKAAEDQLFKELQEKKLLLTCQCCFNEECMPTKCAECNNNHVFCYDCLIRGTEMALAKGETHVKCFTDCQSEISLATLQKVLSPTTFSALLKKRQAAEVMAAEVEGLVSCPYCHFASIPPPEDKVFKCLNPECMKETCRQCKELNHVPLRCDEVIKTDKARLLIEEKMTEALLRTCYKCKRQFYKEDGCNKMKCSCGALMCYLCNKPIKGYNHFNAQGGANANLCPLWSDDKRLNAEAVIKVAEDVKKVIMKQNPNLHIDTEALMPKLPPRSKGPHDDIPNANQLPEHIRRIIGTGP